MRTIESNAQYLALSCARISVPAFDAAPFEATSLASMTLMQDCKVYLLNALNNAHPKAKQSASASDAAAICSSMSRIERGEELPFRALHSAGFVIGIISKSPPSVVFRLERACIRSDKSS
jgi:hypothetical protein